MIIEAVLSFEEEHFNRVCNATIPEAWKVEICDPGILGDDPERGIHCMCYAYGDTREEAIELFIDALKDWGIEHGQLRLTRS